MSRSWLAPMESAEVPSLIILSSSQTVNGEILHLCLHPCQSREMSSNHPHSQGPISSSLRGVRSSTDPRVRFVAIDFLRPNGPLFCNFLEATDLACPGLKRVVLQTGAKVRASPSKHNQSDNCQHYGFQYRDLNTPPVEDTPRYTGPENIFYYEQEDDLFAIQKRRNTWNYNIIRPWGIIGFSWQYLGINETLPIAQYFLICRELGQSPKWPGTLESWNRVESQSYAPGIADLTIWAATHDQCKDEAFNHVNSDVIVWKHLWHLLAEYFKAPMADFEAPTAETKSIDLAEWAKDKKSTWEKIVAKSGGDAEAFQLDAFALMNWYITPSLQKGPFPGTSSKAHDLGWQRSDDTYRAWLGTMRAYENAGVLPMS
ncbi:unnamed protein product [Penicillium salamii]|nr:unnamed protein product [Penicillium salamii]